MQFYNYTKENVDLFAIVAEQKRLHGQNLKVHIGTDSAAEGGSVHYFSVIAFRHSKTGVHFIYSKETVNSYRTESGKPDIFTRLLRECQLTMDIAVSLTDAGMLIHDDIMLEFDYNNLIETVSNKLVAAARGWATGYGFKFMVKYKANAHRPDQWEDQIAAKAANHLCQ